MTQRNQLHYLKKYNAQKSAAKQRAMPWNLTFDEWYAFWGDDIDKRGLKFDCLVMGVTDKELGFQLDNIYKTTKAGVVQDAMKKGSKQMRSVRTPDGDFRSLSDAARHHGFQGMQVIHRIRGGHPGWEYSDGKPVYPDKT